MLLWSVPVGTLHQSISVVRVLRVLTFICCVLFWKEGWAVLNMRDYFLCDFDHVSSLICGNKMPTRGNRGFYCRSYCLPNVSGCSILQTGHITLSSTPDQQLENHSMKYHRQQPLYNTLELLMMGTVVPETCWASSKICNKNLCCI